MGKKKKEKEKKQKEQKEKLKKLEKAAQKAAGTKKDKSDKKTAGNTAAGKTTAGKTTAGKATAGKTAAGKTAEKPAGGRSQDRLRDMAERFRALGDENRLQILMLLGERELCAGEILESMSIAQSTLSHHMKILTESGTVRCRRQGKWVYYSVDRGTLEMLEYDGRGGNDYDEKR